MNYTMDLKLRKEINKEILHKRKPEFKIRYYMYRVLIVVAWLVFIVPFIMTIPMLVHNIMVGWISDSFACGAIWLIAFIAAMIVAIIPLCIRSTFHKKYLMPWVGDSEANVEITDKYIEYGFYNPWYGEHYWTNKIRFSQLVQIEYDENQKMLRVYGPMEVGEWLDTDKSYCFGKQKADPDAGMSEWIELPAFYENFEGLKKELVEKSGKEIINNQREFIYYG